MQLFDVLTTDLDLAFVLVRRCQVIGELHAQPRFWRAAESFGQPYGHLQTTARLAVKKQNPKGCSTKFKSLTRAPVVFRMQFLSRA